MYKAGGRNKELGNFCSIFNLEKPLIEVWLETNRSGAQLALIEILIFCWNSGQICCRSHNGHLNDLDLFIFITRFWISFDKVRLIFTINNIVIYISSTEFVAFEMSEWLLFHAKWAICFSYTMARTSYTQWDNGDVRFVLNQNAELDFYSVSSLKQQSAGRHVIALTP